MPPAIYVGGVFEYFFGDTRQLPGGEVSGNIWQFMGEGGYDIGLGDVVVVRPKAGLGLASLNGEGCIDGAGCTDNSETNLAFAPGTTFILLTQSLSLSLDLRYEMVFADADTLNALIVSAGIGF